MRKIHILLIVVMALSLGVAIGLLGSGYAQDGDPAIRISEGNILLENGNLTLGGIEVWERGGCLATRHFTSLGENVSGTWESGYLRIAHGATPSGEHANQSGFLQIYAKSDDLLYLMNSTGGEHQIVNLTPDGFIRIISNNAAIEFEDDGGNFARIKVGNSQLTFEADPDAEVVSTDIVFKMDGNEVARFQQGGQFQSLDSIIAKEGFATELWDVSGGNWETAVVNTEYYSPNQHGGIYGTVYRQYFTTTLPSSLTSGDNVSKIVDYCVMFKYTTAKRGIAHGMAATYTSSEYHIIITLSGASGNGNLSWDNDTYTPIDGWVDYTKP